MPSEDISSCKKQLLKAEKVAQMLDISVPRVYHLAREVLPPGVVVRIGRQMRFDHDALLEWIAKGGSR